MSDKQKIRQKYITICKKSFDTKLNSFLFSKCVEDKGDVSSFLIDEFKKYSITDETVKLYAAVYRQREYDYKIGEETIINIYSLIETWKRLNTKILAKWKKDYKNAFSRMLPYEYFGNFLKGNQCHYCNIKLSDIAELIDRQKLFKKRETRGFGMEIDRKEPNREYSKDNIVLCCYWCNNAKTDEFTEVEFQPIADKIREVWEKRLAQ